MIHRHGQKLFYWDSSGMRVGPFDSMERALDHFLSHLTSSLSYESEDLLRKLTESVATLYGEYRRLEIAVEDAKEERDLEFLDLSDKLEATEKQNTELREFIVRNQIGSSNV